MKGKADLTKDCRIKTAKVKNKQKKIKQRGTFYPNFHIYKCISCCALKQPLSLKTQKEACFKKSDV